MIRSILKTAALVWIGEKIFGRVFGKKTAPANRSSAGGLSAKKIRSR